MLLRFRAGNHLSLREPQELSMVASRAIKGDESGLIDCPAAGEKLVPAAIIYGANASGKTNVVKALAFMQWQVLYSHNRRRSGRPIDRAPFGLDPKARMALSSCDIDFVVDGVRYHYGFEASDSAFESEWLVSYPSGRRSNLFTRKGADITFGRSLKGQNAVVRDLTRANSLFLSAAAQNNHKELSKIASFFENLHANLAVSVDANSVHQAFLGSLPPKRLIEFLNRAGTGVFDYRLAEREVVHAWQTPNDLLDDPLDDFNVIELGHHGSSGESAHFDLEQESAGTRRLLVLLQDAYHTLGIGSVMVIDELDASLHTQVCEAIVGLFCSRKTNRKGAQLIATTHDTNLLRSPLIRRDQIWFTEKDEGGATHLYPLTDIATRQGDNLEKGYLQGRFGAIPFAGSVADIIAAE